MVARLLRHHTRRLSSMPLSVTRITKRNQVLHYIAIKLAPGFQMTYLQLRRTALLTPPTSRSNSSTVYFSRSNLILGCFRHRHIESARSIFQFRGGLGGIQTQQRVTSVEREASGIPSIALPAVSLNAGLSTPFAGRKLSTLKITNGPLWPRTQWSPAPSFGAFWAQGRPRPKSEKPQPAPVLAAAPALPCGGLSADNSLRGC